MKRMKERENLIGNGSEVEVVVIGDNKFGKIEGKTEGKDPIVLPVLSSFKYSNFNSQLVREPLLQVT
ncbi:hypothetical protein E2542_SST05645 [Spatholobus suberectus]|nr:hypothetical protein E2542_SST05645 [Spatholobus suberectus]